jgi:hypothetical protein
MESLICQDLRRATGAPSEWLYGWAGRHLSALSFCSAGSPKSDKPIFSLLLHPLPEAEGFAHQLDQMRMMGQAV